MTDAEVYDELYSWLGGKSAAKVARIWIDDRDERYKAGYSAGYAARDKLCLASCGDGGKPVDRD